MEVGIEACANNLKTSIQNFEYAGLVAADGDLSDYKNYTFSSNFAADSDVYKLMEGMAYAITNYKDSTDDGHKAAVQKIRDYFEDWIPKIVSAQSADGYIDTLYTLKNYLNLTPDGRFKKKAWWPSRRAILTQWSCPTAPAWRCRALPWIRRRTPPPWRRA